MALDVIGRLNGSGPRHPGLSANDRERSVAA